MEIERQFLVDGLPQLPEEYELLRQGYVALLPEIRIRQIGNSNFTLTVKRGAGLVREEWETEISRQEFDNLAGRLCPGTCIIEKRRYNIPLSGGFVAELHVHEGHLAGFNYVEVEFSDVEAAKKEFVDYSGAGWLFAIGRVSEAELHQMLCEDMSGRTLFAQDNKGGYYIYYHPTDVRYMRETPEAMKRDQEEWSRLCSWAWSSVRKNFIADNPGLSPLTADNSSIGIYMANLSYKPGMKYSLGRKGKKDYSGEDARALLFAEKLLYGNTFEMVQGSKKVRGDYVKLSLPKENTELYFFRYKGENFVLEKRAGLDDNLYKVVPVEEHAEAWNVMQEWLEAVAAR